MKCPNCNASIPDTWKSCRCGYNLVTAKPVEIPLYKKNIERAKLIEKRRKFMERTSAPSADSVENSPSYVTAKRSADATQILDAESLVEKQKAEMQKASEAIRRRNKDADATTQILNVSETPIDMASQAVSGISQQGEKAFETISEGAKADTVAKELSVSAGPVRKLTFHGGRGKYFLIFFVNRLLTIPTLGFYYFWGKIKERRYLHNHTSFEGDNFEYHARGLELLLGYFKISILLIAANSIQYIQLFNKSDVFYYLSIGISFLMFLIFYPLIVILTVRFRYSRTSWRGIRFSFRGAIKEYMKIYIVGMILTILTFGIYFHFLHHKSREYLVRNAYFGDTKFEYFGNGWDLFANYLKVYIMSVVIIISIGILSLSSIQSIESGEKSLINYISAFSILLFIIPTIYWLRFEAQRHRYYWEKTSFSALNFDLKLTEYNYCKLKILNLFIFLFTLGLASPVIDIRNLERLYSDLDIKGNVDFNEIIQDARSTSAVGEAVEDALDVDFMGLQVGL